VTTPEILPFADEHLDGAAELLAGRHRRHRQAEPLLSSRYEDLVVARDELVTAYTADHASGTVAVDGSRVVGYLLGAPKASPAWGENIWVESAGHAVGDPETARALYGGAAARWVDEGRTAHYALLPSHDAALIGAWFRLAFGHQHTHAIRRPAEAGPVREGLVLRQPVRGDIPTLARLDMALPEHQALSPVFSSGPPDVYEERVADWEEDFDNPKFWNVVAEHDGQIVGSAVGCSLEVSSSHAGPARPDRAAFLGFAAVFPEARGLGAGRALGEAVSAWALQEGYASIVTDWRETNLLSSRAWRGLGYRDTFTRVHRLVGH
jgi:ribosomal protein S18 acetylase RimI-like enzyme